MSVNFYNSIGFMGGLDVHEYILYPKRKVAAGYVVYILGFGAHAGTLQKRTERISANGFDMYQDGFDWYFIPHIPAAVPGPPGPEEAVVLADIFFGSGSKPFLSVHSVTGQGEPLSTCVYGSWGLNVNCWIEGLSVPSGVVVQENTVTTTPTIGDYIGAVAGLVADNIVGVFVDDLPSAALKHLIRRLPDILKELGIEPPSFVDFDLPGKIKKAVQEAVDEAV